MHQQRWWVVGGTIALSACTASSAPDTPATVTPYVTESVAATMSNGKFLIADPTDPTPHLTRLQARDIAEYAGRVFGPMQASMIEGTGAGPVSYDKLRACGVVRWIEPSGVPPTEAVLPYAHWFYGPWWLVTLCDGRGPKVAAAVAAYATHLYFENGELRFGTVASGPRGDEFWLRGIPPTWQEAIPLTPETAVARFAGRSQRRIDRTPRLIAPPPPVMSPFDAKWEMSLERTVRVRSSANGEARDVQRVYVGNRRTAERGDEPNTTVAAAVNSPAVLPIKIPTRVGPDGGFVMADYDLLARDSLPLVVDVVTEEVTP